MRVSLLALSFFAGTYAEEAAVHVAPAQTPVRVIQGGVAPARFGIPPMRPRTVGVPYVSPYARPVFRAAPAASVEPEEPEEEEEETTDINEDYDAWRYQKIVSSAADDYAVYGDELLNWEHLPGAEPSYMKTRPKIANHKYFSSMTKYKMLAEKDLADALRATPDPEELWELENNLASANFYQISAAQDMAAAFGINSLGPSGLALWQGDEYFYRNARNAYDKATHEFHTGQMSARDYQKAQFDHLSVRGMRDENMLDYFEKNSKKFQGRTWSQIMGYTSDAATYALAQMEYEDALREFQTNPSRSNELELEIARLGLEAGKGHWWEGLSKILGDSGHLGVMGAARAYRNEAHIERLVEMKMAEEFREKHGFYPQEYGRRPMPGPYGGLVAPYGGVATPYGGLRLGRPLTPYGPLNRWP